MMNEKEMEIQAKVNQVVAMHSFELAFVAKLLDRLVPNAWITELDAAEMEMLSNMQHPIRSTEGLSTENLCDMMQEVNQMVDTTEWTYDDEADE